MCGLDDNDTSPNHVVMEMLPLPHCAQNLTNGGETLLDPKNIEAG